MALANKTYQTYQLIYLEGQIMEHALFYRKKSETMDFSETMTAGDLKVGRCRQHIDYSRYRSLLI